MHDALSPDTKLTKHFKYRELNTRMAPCKDFVVLNLIQLALFLEIVRWTYGRPIIVTSGFRSSQHNKEVGGVSNSMHLLGKAVDIAPQYPSFVPSDFFDSLTDEEKRKAKDLYYDKLYKDLCFHVTRTSLPPDHYIKFYGDRHFIHIHFGSRDEEPINLLPFFPFTKV